MVKLEKVLNDVAELVETELLVVEKLLDWLVDGKTVLLEFNGVEETDALEELPGVEIMLEDVEDEA